MDKKIKRKIKQKLGLFGIVSFIFIALYCLTIVFVLVWALMNSVKSQYDFNGIGGYYPSNYFGLPRIPDSSLPSPELLGGWHFDNYALAFKIVAVTIGGNTVYTLDTMLINSLLFSTTMAFFGVFTPFITAYCCAKFEFKIKGLIYTTAIIVMMIPIVGSLSSELLIQRQLRLENLIGVCIIKNKYTGMYFLVFYGTFKSLSTTYMEAARVDGAGEYSIFFKIMLPLAKTSILSIFILLFITNWNDYYTPMMFLPYMPTLARGLQQITSAPAGQISTHFPVKLGSAMICALPTLALFVIFRKQIMGNITMGGIKG